MFFVLVILQRKMQRGRERERERDTLEPVAVIAINNADCAVLL